MEHLVLLPLREGQVEDLFEILGLHLAVRILLVQLGEVPEDICHFSLVMKKKITRTFLCPRTGNVSHLLK